MSSLRLNRNTSVIYLLTFIVSLFSLADSLTPIECTRWNEYAEKFEFTTPYFNLKYSGTAGNMIDNQLLQLGAWDKPVLNILKNLSKELNDKNLVFLDIGANTGLHSLFMSQLSKEVHSIEPYPPILTKLHNNIKINELQNVTVHEVGFGNKNDTLPFYSPPNDNHGVGSFSPSFSKNFNKDGKNGILKLDIKVGDEYLTTKGISKIDLIKLDIEGYEKFALEGLSKSLNTNRPFIIMELNMYNEEGFKSYEEIINYLPTNYSLIEISVEFNDLKNGTYLLRPLQSEKSQNNIIAYPKEKESIINSISNSSPLTSILE